MLMGGALFSSKGFKFNDPLDFIPEKLDTDRGFRFTSMSTTSSRAIAISRGENPCRYGRTAVPQDVPASCSVERSPSEEHQHLAVFFRGADSVDTGNAGNNDHILRSNMERLPKDADGRVHRSVKYLFQCKDPCGEHRLQADNNRSS